MSTVEEKKTTEVPDQQSICIPHPTQRAFLHRLPGEWGNACFDNDELVKAIPKAKFVVWDTETTGTSCDDVVIELGFVLYSEAGEILYSQSRILPSQRLVSPRAQEIHQIPQSEVDTSPFDTAEEILNFARLCFHVVETQGGVVVAHNAVFDERMLAQTAKAEGLQNWSFPPVFCTLKAAKNHFPQGDKCTNDFLFLRFGGDMAGVAHHRAVDDAKMTGFIFFHGLREGFWDLALGPGGGGGKKRKVGPKAPAAVGSKKKKRKKKKQKLSASSPKG